QFRLMVFHPNISFEKLKTIKAPVLVMAGDRDAIKTEHTVKIYQAIPNAQLCIVPGSTHFFASEKPNLFNEIVADFFERPFEMPSTIKISQQWAEQIMKQAKNK
ncbi:MAG: alpha/beta hydrolase, partial [Ferruginibacter sp.]